MIVHSSAVAGEFDEAVLRVPWNLVEDDEAPLSWSQQVTAANP